MPYSEFHLGYKQSVLAADELVLALHLPRRFSEHRSYQRKVGTRNAQAIAKICLAGLGKASDIRLAIGSMGATPLRLHKTEQILRGGPSTLLDARKALAAEVSPMDDIRSTAAYRLQVAGNLLEEFVEGLFA